MELPFREFDLSAASHEPKQERMISVRVPHAYKVKYDIIQARSKVAKQPFSEYIREMLMSAIDRVEMEKAG